MWVYGAGGKGKSYYATHLSSPEDTFRYIPDNGFFTLYYGQQTAVFDDFRLGDSGICWMVFLQLTAADPTFVTQKGVHAVPWMVNQICFTSHNDLYTTMEPFMNLKKADDSTVKEDQNQLRRRFWNVDIGDARQWWMLKLFKAMTSEEFTRLQGSIYRHMLYEGPCPQKVAFDIFTKYDIWPASENFRTLERSYRNVQYEDGIWKLYWTTEP